MTDYKDKKVLILGLGLNGGGEGAARFFAKKGAKVRVTDLKTGRELESSLENLKEFENIEYSLGGHKFEDIDWADLIIRNPALRPDNKFRVYAQNSGKRVELDMGILLENFPVERIIGVTGTKGKSTTSSLIYRVLEQSGKKVVFAGNIGRSVLDVVDILDEESLLVLEISSFQLEAFEQHKVSPKYSVITNIYEDHLNYYQSKEEYAQSKRVIAKYQKAGDFLFLWDEDEVTQRPEFKKDLKGKIINFSKKDLDNDFKPNLKGDHNRVNMAASLAVTKVLGVSEEEALRIMGEFEGVPFRFELIYKSGGIKIYNDTTATNPAAATQSLKSLPSSILITGGVNANMDYREFADTIDKLAKAVYFLEGDSTDEIKKYLKHKNILRSTYTDLYQLLKDVHSEAKEGDTILFSPGAKSFNLFDNEFDRGRKFNEAVRSIFK